MNTAVSAEFIGLIAAVLSALSLVPQIQRTWVTRSARDLSYGWLVTALTAMVLWVVYGMMLDGWSVILANTVAGAMIAALIVMKLLFDRPQP